MSSMPTMAEFHEALAKPCREKTDRMFPEYDEESHIDFELARVEALAVAEEFCKGCPFRKPCLRFAMDTETEYGVFAGYWLDDPKQLYNAKKSNQRNKRKEAAV